MPRLTLVQAVNDALRVEMERNDRIVVFGEDVGKNGGVFRATEGLQERFGADRVADTPLAESMIVGVAVGMAAYGYVPVPEIQFMSFIYPAVDQIISHVCRYRNRSKGRFPMSMVIRTPYGGGIRAPELHSESCEAVFVHAPGIKVVVPSTPYDAKGLLIAALRDPDPVLFMEPLRLYRAAREEVPEEAYEVPLGEARVARQGEDVSVFAWGAMVPVALEAAKRAAAARRIEAEVVDLRTLYPLDVQAIAASVRKTGRAVVVHEAPRTAGVGAEIVSLINEHAFLSLEAPVARVTAFDVPLSLYAVEEWQLPSAARVLRAIEATVGF